MFAVANSFDLILLFTRVNELMFDTRMCNVSVFSCRSFLTRAHFCMHKCFPLSISDGCTLVETCAYILVPFDNFGLSPLPRLPLHPTGCSFLLCNERTALHFCGYVVLVRVDFVTASNPHSPLTRGFIFCVVYLFVYANFGLSQ